MKNTATKLMLAAAMLLAVAGSSRAAVLQVELAPQFGGVPLVFDAVSNLTSAGQRVSVTRLDFLLSRIELHRVGGDWIGNANWLACIKARDGRTRFELGDIPAGKYDGLRFQVGLDPAANHADVDAFPAGHPLNPEVNGLHWGWAGGYVFLALEGRWLADDGKLGGYSYHLATDAMRMPVELSATLELAGTNELRLILDVAKLFAPPNPIRLDDSTATTHSRTNDALALSLRDRVMHAFSVGSVSTGAGTVAVAALKSHLEMAAGATPYRLTISHFFPRPELPADNPLTEEGVALGRRLFQEARLSVNNAQSCASCHQAGRAFSDTNALSLGAEGGTGTRNAMPLLNLAWKDSFFWDGRAASLREQVLQPIQNPVEMHEPLAQAVAKLAAGDGYQELFARAFGSPEITADRLARALEQFLLVQVSHDSKFDRVLNGEAQLTAEEQRGFELFHTEYDPRRGQFGADCFHCHGGPLFQSQSFANNGLDAAFKDAGRGRVTGREGDEGKFAVPSLRNVELTGPYMHDGRFGTLKEVVEHYCTGVKRTASLDPNLAKHPEGGVPLSDPDKQALVAFLKTLTDESLKLVKN